MNHSFTSVATARVFSLDLFFFCFIWGSGVFIENLGFSDSGQIFVNVCRITVFSIQEYSSFTGVICAESVTSADVSSGARLNQIV